MGTYSIFQVCLCQYGDANSSSNWRYDKGEYSVLNGIRMADICLASLVYLLVNVSTYVSTYCWFSHDVTKIQTTKLSILLRFYFHGILEQLKTNFQTNLFFKRVLGFVIEYA